MKKNVVFVLASFYILIMASCEKSPVACFNFSKTTPKVGDTITLNNCSTNFTDVKWDFPLGGTTSVVSPRVKLQNAGVYPVTLTVGKDNFNNQNSITNTITVLP